MFDKLLNYLNRYNLNEIYFEVPRDVNFYFEFAKYKGLSSDSFTLEEILNITENKDTIMMASVIDNELRLFEVLTLKKDTPVVSLDVIIK